MYRRTLVGMAAAGLLAMTCAWAPPSASGAVAPTVGMARNRVDQAEGDAGAATVTLTAQLSGPSASTVSVHWTTLDRTAKAGQDYVAASGQLSFPPGVVTRSIAVQVKGDTTLEPYESFLVRLSNPVNAGLGKASERVQILNDELPPVAMVGVGVTEGATARVKIKLTQRYFRPVTLLAHTADGTARAPADYAAVSTPISFKAGSTSSVFVDIRSAADSLAEPAEYFLLDVGGSSATITIAASAGSALVTNEFAFFNPTASGAVLSPVWEMTSGSLFSTADGLWTGVPDVGTPNSSSSNATNSAVFRLTTKAKYADGLVSFDLTNHYLTSTTRTPKNDWDGVHIFLRYQSEQQLYYASVNRRDGTVVVKKKCVGGTDNGGTYYPLKTAAGQEFVGNHPIPFQSRQHVAASVQNTPGGTVTIRLYREGVLLESVVDSGIGCAPITAPGSTGIRGDNDDFTFGNFSVTGV